MRIRLEDCIDFPASEVTYLNDRLVRFRLASPRKPSEYQQFFLTENASINDVFPEAPNRKAVAYNLASLARLLDAGLARAGDLAFAVGAAIGSRRDLLAFNIDHFCRPAYLYTNGQAVASLVQRSQSRFELACHPSLSSYKQFNSWHTVNDLIQPENLQLVSSMDQAERVVAEVLSAVETYSLRARKGVDLAEVVLQPAGSIPGAQGYPLRTLIATFRDESFRVQMGGPPFGENEPYRILNELRPQGFVLMVCATCEHFQFSRLTRDWSAGSSGYCARALKNGGDLDISDKVSVLHWCSEYSFVEDEERRRPYISRK